MKKANQFTRVGTFCEKCRQVICICKPEINPPMQKKLITDQLIEEYQKELDALELRLLKANKLPKELINLDMDRKRRDDIQEFIIDLQSLRQQEVQNVMTAFYDGTINESNCGKEYYFTSIFQQEKGEVKK